VGWWGWLASHFFIVCVGSATQRGTCLTRSFSAWPPSEPGGPVSEYPALQRLRRELWWLRPCMDVLVAAVADHQGLTTAFHHLLDPYGLIRTGLDEVGKLMDVMHLDAIRSPA
jgi:hypothetical protein